MKTAKKTCPYHGSKTVNGKCPACAVEREGWAKDNSETAAARQYAADSHTGE